MNLKRILSTLVIIISLICSNLNAKQIFFDMGGVLLKTSKFEAFKKLGWSVIMYPNIEDRFFEFLHFIDKEKDKINQICCGATFKGNKLPTYLCKWQKGDMSPYQITDYILKQIDLNPDFFVSDTEKELIKTTTQFFIPENQVTITSPIKNMVKLARKLKKKKDKKGKPLNTLYLASNFDPITFKLFKKTFPEINELFDQDKQIISGNIGYMKPDKKFYDHIVTKFKLPKKECILIDDQKENVDGAIHYGINGILYQKESIDVQRQLKKLGAL